jgi:hypothetical protein
MTPEQAANGLIFELRAARNPTPCQVQILVSQFRSIPNSPVTIAVYYRGVWSAEQVSHWHGYPVEWVNVGTDVSDYYPYGQLNRA